MTSIKTIKIWGIQFHPYTKLQLVSMVQTLLRQGKTGIHLTGVNPETVMMAQKDENLRRAINDSNLVNVDNMLVTLLLRLSGFSVPERAATPDIFELFLQEANREKQSVFFLGASEEVLQKMLKNVRVQYPDIKIVGAQNGFYKDEETIVKMIAAACPTYLFLGLPTPRKENFIMKYKHILNAGVCYGVGGAFDVKGGKVARVPAWLGNLGLEGFFRIFCAPGNYGRRVFKYYPGFLSIFWQERKNGYLQETEL